MTENQTKVITEFRKLGCDFLASHTESTWNEGREYYIDTRVKVSRRLREMFKQGNREATHGNA